MEIGFTIDKSKIKALTSGQVQKVALSAFARALTATAFDVRKATQDELPKWLKLTRPFIKQSVVYERATVKNLVATVGFLERVPLINKMEEGGIRKPRGRAIAVPAGVARSARGGITKANRPRAVLSKKNVFSDTIGGIGGIWRRRGKKLELLYRYASTTSYDKGTTKFRPLAEKVVQKKLGKQMTYWVDREMAKIKS
jgi:hypothetical protein